MSIFGYYFVGSLLREAGWPREQGVSGGAVYDATVVDATIDQMVDWAASIGAGRTHLALQMIATMFRDRDWNGDNRPKIEHFVTAARESWDETRPATPQEFVQPLRTSSAFGPVLTVDDFQDRQFSLALEQNVLHALLWGLSNPGRFATWYSGEIARHESAFGAMQEGGLQVDSLPRLSELFGFGEEIVRDYEEEVGTLSAIPPTLLSDARAAGVLLSEPE